MLRDLICRCPGLTARRTRALQKRDTRVELLPRTRIRDGHLRSSTKAAAS